MHSFLIITNNSLVKDKELKKLLDKLTAKAINFNLTKIADVRQLLQITRIKILEKTAIVIENFNLASEEAQNSFLKELEEPQQNLYYVLTATSENQILPTIISRCNLIKILPQNTNTSKESIQKTKDFIQRPTSQKIKIISQISNREEALFFLNEILINTHQLFLKNFKLANFLKSLQHTIKNLQANGNVQLQLTNFIIQIS